MRQLSISNTLYATDNTNRKLAVKVIFSKDEQQYKIEATIMKYGLLNHPNIVNFFLADRVDTGVFTELWLVTEYYQFGSLYKRLFINYCLPIFVRLLVSIPNLLFMTT